MSPKKEDIIKKVNQWVEIANEDLQMAKHGFTISSNVPYRLIAFHSQQCAEKYLKAFLVFNSIDFPYTHEIEKLLNLIPEEYKLTGKLKEAFKLSDYAVARRYPDFYLSVSKEEAEYSVKLAEDVKKEITTLFRLEGIKFPDGS